MPRRSYDIIFTLALFALYTAVALSLAAIGALVYINTTNTLSENYDQRTSVLYVAQKLRQNDGKSLIRVDSLGGGDALVMTEYYEGKSYETWLYVSDGQLREVLMAADIPPKASYGQAIMPMQSMSVDVSRLSDGLVVIEFTMASGDKNVVEVFLKSLGSS